MCETMLGSLPALTMKITEQQLYDYADVSQDTNPLHLDKEFAETTTFGDRIAHGMLTLSLIYEMMTSQFGLDWIESGSLKVRFKGPAYIGDVIESYGKVEKWHEERNRRFIECSVGIINGRDNQEIITGTAKLQIDLLAASLNN
ncbi:MAG: acyl dehydratase [Dehalococcoidia bacterium]|nr:acyl dehydratase [Dehalococcoidia bacterium]